MTIGPHGPGVLDNLRNARWDNVAKTNRSSHAALIGLTWREMPPAYWRKLLRKGMSTWRSATTAQNC